MATNQNQATRSEEKRSTRDALNGARTGIMEVIHDLKTARELCAGLGKPELARALSIAITEAETASLWADKANADLPL